MIKLMRTIEEKANRSAIALKTRMMMKKPGDGHYVAIALGLLITLALGGVFYSILGGKNGMFHTWITNISSKVTGFVNSITSDGN